MPQGTNLGTILFILVINDLSARLQLSKLLKYTDDTKLFLAVAGIDEVNLLQRDLDSFREWSIENGLLINFDKSKVISFYRGNRLVEVDYSVGFQSLERVESIRDLGVIYDSTLYFNEQIDKVVWKALRILLSIRYITLDLRNVSTIVYLYKTPLLPILTYNSVACFPRTDNDFRKLISIEHQIL